MISKVCDGVKTFLDKAKSRSVPLYFGAIMTFDTDSLDSNMGEESGVRSRHSIDLPWSLPEDHNANNETRLLRYEVMNGMNVLNQYKQEMDEVKKFVEYCVEGNLEDEVLKKNMDIEMNIIDVNVGKDDENENAYEGNGMKENICDQETIF
ncbi:hypothetical protein FQA39_LY18401 [Lamprigera yunnana]|nr:hypothetical protein FQA39_LY18401 [Lamprigera yunnana]